MSSEYVEHIVSTPGVLGGKPRIAGHRISVQDVAIWHERMGKSVDEIATEYDLTLGEVYAALSYYHDHRHEIESSIRAGAAFVDEVKQAHPSKLAEKLAERQRGNKSSVRDEARKSADLRYAGI